MSCEGVSAVEPLGVPHSAACISAGGGKQGPSRINIHGKDGASVAPPGAHLGLRADIPALLLQASGGAVEPLSGRAERQSRDRLCVAGKCCTDLPRRRIHKLRGETQTLSVAYKPSLTLAVTERCRSDREHDMARMIYLHFVTASTS